MSCCVSDPAGCSVSGPAAVAIDNKIKQAMDLVKCHLMVAVRGELVLLKEQIKELLERNSELQRENSLLKSLASLQQLQVLSAHLSTPYNPQLVQWVQVAEWKQQEQGVEWVQRVHRPSLSPQNNSRAALRHTSMTSV